MVYDDEGAPADYIFLEINDAFEQSTGLERKALIGRSVSEALPGILDDPFDWIGTYGKVALGDGAISSDQYAEPLQRWFAVTTYSPEPDHFATVFRDITDQRSTIEELRGKEDQLQQQNRKQAAILRISQVVQEMTQPDDLESVLCVCLEQLRCIGIPAGTMAINLVIDAEALQVETYRVDSNGLLSPPHRRRARMLTEAWATREPIITNQIKEWERKIFLEKFDGLPIVSYYHVPFNLGVVSVHSVETDVFNEGQRRDLQQVAELFSVGVARMTDLSALSESEREWRQLVENVRDVIVSVDLNARIRYINHPAPGKTIEQTLGSDLVDLVHPQDRNRATKTFEHVIERNEDR
tara:strand:- start:2295 stop:3353 length:1059 start_codon:yes stop_codon:yes gene_type:complete